MRKAVCKHKFDRDWLEHITKLEWDHYSVMGAILDFTNSKNSE